MVECIACGNVNNEEALVSTEMKLVSSDVKVLENEKALFFECSSCGLVQKKIDKNWLNVISKIYEQYEMFYQGNGQEQKINTEKDFKSRSKAILDKIKTDCDIKDNDKVIDVGCGNGILLSELDAGGVKLNLYGADIGKVRKSIEKIKNFRKYYSLSKTYTLPKNYFDFIFCVHTIEHILTPKIFIRNLIISLKEKGKIVMVFPNYAENPMDLCIYDHCSHYTPETFSKILDEGIHFNWFYLDKNNKKEIIYIISQEEKIPFPYKRDLCKKKKLINIISNLESYIKKCDYHIENEEAFGVFGTSIGAAWLSNNLKRKPDFFIDEDEERIGKNFLGKKIFSVENTPKDVLILGPINFNIYEKLIEKYKMENKWILINF